MAHGYSTFTQSLRLTINVDTELIDSDLGLTYDEDKGDYVTEDETQQFFQFLEELGMDCAYEVFEVDEVVDYDYESVSVSGTVSGKCEWWHYYATRYDPPEDEVECDNAYGDGDDVTDLCKKSKDCGKYVISATGDEYDLEYDTSDDYY